MFEFGNKVKIKLFGSSHGKHVGLIIKGLPIGYKIPTKKINEELQRRRPDGKYTTKRIENDEFEFISGVKEEVIVGDEITLIVKNKNVRSSDYEKGILRPGHADLGAYLKYGPNFDFNGGNFFSGRMTVVFSCLGAIAKDILSNYGIKIFSRNLSIGKIKDVSLKNVNLFEMYENNPNELINTFSSLKKEKMLKELENVKNEQDSIGGSIETYILNPIVGLGEPYFLSIESYISSLIFSLGGVKGISFGDNQNLYTKKGSQVNDPYYFKDDKIIQKTNHNGGIFGGISVGSPIIFRTYIKPTPSIEKKQHTVSFLEGDKDINIKGRHDVCIALRIRPVIECLTAYALLDLFLLKKEGEVK